MSQVESLVRRAQQGEVEAYDALVRRLQDAAAGYAYSLLGDAALAQDAAQEAFLTAFRELGSLRAPGAFPAWLRRLVFKQCDRIRRSRRAGRTVPLHAAPELPSPAPSSSDLVERDQVRRLVAGAVATLPPGEREATTLHYMGGFSHGEIAAFLGITPSAVGSRLHSARGRLRDRMLGLVEETLRRERPSRDGRFAKRVGDMIRSVKFMLMVKDMDRALAFYRDAIGLALKSASPYWSELTHGDAIVALHSGGSGEFRETGLSFTVDDAEAACRAVVEAGGKLRSGPVERPGEPIVLAEVTDPEGNGFMISQDVG